MTVNSKQFLHPTSKVSAKRRIIPRFNIKTTKKCRIIPPFDFKQGFDVRFLPLSGADEGIILRFLSLSSVNEGLDARFLCQILLFMQETPFPAPLRAKKYSKRVSTARN